MPIERECQFCGKKFNTYPYRLRDGRGKYCSKECKYKGVSLKEVQRTCLECKKNFTTKNKERKFCSRTCQNRWLAAEKKKERIQFQCKFCGKKFFVKPSRAKFAQFCSHSCHLRWELLNKNFKWKDRKGKKNSNWKGGLEKKICGYCGKEFIEKTRSSYVKYCSEECYGKAKTLEGTTQKICEECGKEFTINLARKEKAKYCSRECFGKILSQKRKGDKNPAWINGLSTFPYPLDFSKKLKRTIRERDGYICQLCGKTETEEKKILGRILSVHHIDYDKSNLNHENLITLCHTCNCHVNVDRNYWQKYFKEQAKEIQCVA